MTKKIITLTSALIISLTMYAQVKDTMVVYFNQQLEAVKKKDAVFVGAAVRSPEGWKVFVYTDSLKLLMRGIYTDETCKVKNGRFTYYNGAEYRYLSGYYAMNKRSGAWQTWYKNGQMKDSIHFKNDVADGEAYGFFPDGKAEVRGWYRMGVTDSIWQWFHDNGKPATRELYRNGKLYDLECFDSSGNSAGFNCAIAREPAIKGQYGGLLKYLADSVRIPEKIREQDEGFVGVRFTVNKAGEASDPEIIGSPDPSFTREIARVIKAISWYPAVSHNRAVEHTYMVNIPYYPKEKGMVPEQLPQWRPFMTEN